MLKRWFGTAFLRVAGWKTEGTTPLEPRYVIIAAPHTSNWDLPFMLAMAFVFDIRVRWMGKHTLFDSALGPLLRRLGGVPVVRHAPEGVVAQMVARFAEEPALVLMVPAEGTRSHVEHWKSGFYRIARGADVPVCLSFLDYGRKVGGIGPTMRLTGDVRLDMDRIRAFYDGVQGLHPTKVGRIRLREEDIERILEDEGERAKGIDRLAGNF